METFAILWMLGLPQFLFVFIIMILHGLYWRRKNNVPAEAP